MNASICLVSGSVMHSKYVNDSDVRNAKFTENGKKSQFYVQEIFGCLVKVPSHFGCTWNHQFRGHHVQMPEEGRNSAYTLIITGNHLCPGVVSFQFLAHLTITNVGCRADVPTLFNPITVP